MARLVHPIGSSWIGEIAKTLSDCATIVFSLSMGQVVVPSGYLKLDLKVLHNLLLEVQHVSTVSVRDHRERVSLKNKYHVQKDLGSVLCINILEDWEQVSVATEVIQHKQIEVAFLVG
jgi:hypothetical protein